MRLDAERTEQLSDQITRLNELIEESIRVRRDWKIALRNGVLAGLGGVLGTSIVISLLIWLLKPFEQIRLLGPVLERIERDLDKPNSKR